MEAPVAAEVETKSEKKTDETERAKSYDCGLCDIEVVYKIAQELLPGLASSCVDNTTGGIFTSAGSVAADMRKEMADYLTKRSETYVAEFLLSENSSGSEISEHPFDIILNLIDDFSASKRNMFSRVSEWVLSDRRDDRIDDFVQEMEINGFWLLARREYIASVLLKNVDYKNAFHCNMVCNSEDEIIKHRLECKFRPIDCTNEGCTTRYCAAQKEHHEAVCPFMILPCEQKCSDYVMRREMDRHCVTICPMKLVNCSFYTVGCNSSIPRCNVQQHNADDLSSHLLYIIRTAHKDASDDDLKHRVEQIRNLSNIDKLAKARDARALTFLIKDAEAKVGPLEEVKTNESNEDSNKKESPTKTEQVLVKDGSDSPMKKEEQPSTEKPAIKEEEEEEEHTKFVLTEEKAESPVKIEESEDKEESFSSPSKEDNDVSSEEKKSEGLPAEEKEQRGSPIKGNLEEQSQRDENETPREVKVDDEPKKETIREASANEEEESKKSLSSSNEEDAKKSPKKETTPKQSSKDDGQESPKTEISKQNEEVTSRRESFYSDYYSDEESMKSPS